MDIAIIGAGFCGLAVTWHLIHHHPPFPHLKIHLFDSKGIGQGTSGIAAGLLHPFAGAHSKLNWRGLEGIQATQELLTIASSTIGSSVIGQSSGILRLALTKEQETDFSMCANRYPQETQWLNPSACQALVPGCRPVPGLWIKDGLIIHSSLYLKGLWEACKQRDVRFEQRHIDSLQELEHFDQIIVTGGAESLQLPELSHLPLKTVKGQVLELAWPPQCKPLTCALNSHVYILMTEGNRSCLLGATYERDAQYAGIDIEKAKRELLPKAFEMFPPLQKAEVINCYAGMRAVAPQHHPLIQCLSSSQWLLSGMGSKGLLYHALFAQELVRMIFKASLT